MINITQIPAPRVEFIDPRTGLMSREWYRFFLNLYTLTGSGSTDISLEDIQVGPADQSFVNFGSNFQDALLTSQTGDTGELKQQIDTLKQEFNLQPVFPAVSSGAFFNIVGPPTAGSVAYGDGTSIIFSPTYLSVSPTTGNIVAAIPTSGNTLTVNGRTGSSTISSTNLTSGSGTEYHFQATNATDSNFNVTVSQVGATTKYAHMFTASSTSLYLGTASTARLTISNVGNVAINAPSSGTTLTLTSFSSGYSMLVNDVGGGGCTFRNATNTAGYDIGLLAGTANADAYVYQRANANLIVGTNNATRITISNIGAITVAAPSSAANSFTVNGITGSSTFSSINLASGSGTEYHFQATNGTDSNFNLLLTQVGNATKYAHLFTATATSLLLGTSSTARITIGSTGNVTIAAPTAGQALTLTGTAAGTAALTINTSATTGIRTATFTATNKPGTANTAPTNWLPIVLGGVTYYIPCWT